MTTTHPFARVEDCRCGGQIIVPAGTRVDGAVRRHNQSLTHVLYYAQHRFAYSPSPSPSAAPPPTAPRTGLTTRGVRSVDEDRGHRGNPFSPASPDGLRLDAYEHRADLR
jgi:hypothetical protein